MKHKRTTFKVMFYLSGILLSAGVLFFLLASSQNRNLPYILTCVCIWLLFVLFCSYKMYHCRRYGNIFHKGEITVHDFDGMDGIAFEELTCDILVSNGFELAEYTQASGDFGVDVLAEKDGMTYAIQCKCYQEPVGIEAVQQVYAGRAYYECHVAVVLTNQYFTSSAIKLADKIGVVLWDRDMLKELI